jgi:hypothetical protein
MQLAPRDAHNKWLAAAVALFVAGIITDVQAIAQTPGSPLQAKKKQNKDRPENHAEHLKDIADTPGVPKYTGKYHFVEGVVFPAAISGPSFTMKFDAQEKPEKVLAWYKDVFDSGKWEIEKVTTDEKKRIGATKDKNICRVLVEKNPNPYFPTRVILTYRLYKSSKAQ